VLSYPSTISLSSRMLNHLADRVRSHRNQRRSRWRRLDAGRQALLALAHLCNGDSCTRLAAGFAVGVSTAWWYVQEAVALLASAADDLATAMDRIRRLAYAILDGTLIPIDRVADQRPYDSGKHRRHGVNVQVIADAAGRLVWASPALPGSVHDLTAARTHGIIEALTSADAMTFAYKGYQGAGGSGRWVRPGSLAEYRQRVPKPAHRHRRRHTQLERRLFGALALRNQAPESALHMPRRHRPARRTHRPIRQLLTHHRTPP
jgi:hypothetical protein